MNKIFRLSKDYVCSPRSGIQFEKTRINTVQFGIESTVHLVEKIWDLITEYIKPFASLDIFKIKIKKWLPEDYPC